MKLTLKDIVYNAFIAALYVALTLLAYPLSFHGIQFRFAEMLLILVFFRKDYIIGLTLGCALANIFSPLGIYDVLFGTLATFISCLFIILINRLAIALIFPVLINGIIVGLELYFLLSEGFWISCLLVIIGELTVLLFGYFITLFLKKRPRFYQIIRAKRNINFIW